MHKTLFLLSVVLCLISCNKSNNRIDKSSWTGVLSCDAENIDESWTITNNKHIHLRGDFIADNSIHLSGQTSIQLNKDHRQGFSFELIGLDFLDKITAKVWRYNNGNNSNISINDKNKLYQFSIPTGKTQGKWEELEVVFNCYSHNPNDTILIQCSFSGHPNDTVWFDDFSCEIESFEQPSLTGKRKNETLSVTLPKSSKKKLSKKREKALNKGILIKEKGDLVEATIAKNKQVKLRLKGDWTDHLIGKKWSFRIEMENKDTWKNMSKFSIQSPTSRSMMNEWVFHKMLEAEQVLTTPYFFMPVEINEENIGIMAVEEHFTQDLLKNLNKPLGPILKFNEDYLWDLRINNLPIFEYPIIQSAEVKVFSRKHFNSSPESIETMNKARWLLYAHQHNLLPLDSIFDIDKLAKYLAISDLIGASHSYIWHNRRFYYNIEKNRLEPIVFDGTPTVMPSGNDAEIMKFLDTKVFHEKSTFNLLASLNFREKFKNYLYEFSSKGYLENFFKASKTEYQSTESILQQEYLNYQFRKNELFYRAEIIHKKLATRIGKSEEENISNISISTRFSPLPTTKPFPGISVIAYRSESKGDTSRLEIVNFHHEKVTTLSPIKNIELNPFKSPNLPEAKTISFIDQPNFIEFTTPSSKEIYKVKVSKYSLPKRLN